jgi:hypothetical protein
LEEAVSTQLAEALKELNLQPGQVRRVAVNGGLVEIRAVPPEELSDFPDALMVDLWLEPPARPVLRVLHPRIGPLALPDPPLIPADEEAV